MDAKAGPGIDTRPQQSTETQSTSSQSANKNQGKIYTLFIKLSPWGLKCFKLIYCQ
jgi:hypothetical protein